MALRLSSVFKIGTQLGMLGTSGAILLGLCRACTAVTQAGDPTLLLASLGLAYTLLRLTASARNESTRLREVDLLATLLASMVGVWLLTIALTKPTPCPLCVAFWLCHFATLAQDVARSPRTARLALPAMAVSVLCLGAIRADRAAWSNLLAFVTEHSPSAATAKMARPGDEIRPEIVLKPTTRLVIWTTCLPCQRVAATNHLQAFLRRYPDARVWVARGAEKNLPSEMPDTWNIVPEFFFETLGISSSSPPAYALLEGHRIKSIGWLKEYE